MSVFSRSPCRKVNIGNCPMIAFDLYNCTVGMVCAVFCLENIDFALCVLRNRINWCACFFLLGSKGHSVLPLSFPFSCIAPSWTFSRHSSGNLNCGEIFKRKAICSKDCCYGRHCNTHVSFSVYKSICTAYETLLKKGFKTFCYNFKFSGHEAHFGFPQMGC